MANWTLVDDDWHLVANNNPNGTFRLEVDKRLDLGACPSPSPTPVRRRPTPPTPHRNTVMPAEQIGRWICIDNTPATRAG
ncbi:hypothetical protein ACIQZB_44155 [Streptomyces sp. NPDC097727]|uniref:hypothetical protein n=1 Tax=Streptomyces sp. NPDC097727 TaxID=3366092 RepID=UPI003807A099